jgi:alpha-galactosidase
MVVALANWRNESQSVSIDLARAIGVKSAHAKDVWAGRNIGSVTGAYETDLAAHELQILILSKIKPSALRPIGTGYHSASTATLTGSATLSPCTQGECLPAGAKVTDIASNSTVTFSSVQAPSAGTQTLAVDFINYDVAMGSAWEWGSNTRNMTIAVNGGAAKRWAFPLSGGDWFESGRLLVEVDGFEEGEGNIVAFAGSQGDAWAPELVGFELLEYQ